MKNNNNLVVQEMLRELEKTIKICEDIQEKELESGSYDEAALEHHLNAYRSVFDHLHQLIDKYTI